MCVYDDPSVFDPHLYLNNYQDLEQHGLCDYDHPSVFDPHFYLNNYQDLVQHGGGSLHTKEAAARHWCNHGVDEGRQATSTFHTKQYIGNYVL